MGGTCDHDAIWVAFGSRKWDVRSRAVADAYRDPHADELLARMLDTSNEQVFEKVVLAAHLGDLHGDAGVDALERATNASGPGSRDLRCAALLALAKRCGAQATEQLRVALTARDGAVRDYAVIGLAGAGDDGAWDEVFKRLSDLLRRSLRSTPSEVAMSLAYLSQHVQESDRRSRLVDFMRRRWDEIAEADWVGTYWPEAAPDGPPIAAVPVPDATAIRTWVRDPLFADLGPPMHA